MSKKEYIEPVIRERILELKNNGLYVKDISIELNISDWVVRKTLYGIGSTEEKRNNILKRNAEIERLYKDGYSDAEISRKIGVHTATVQQYRTKKGYPKNLTKLQSKVKELRTKGLCCSEISKTLGMDTKQVRATAQAIGMPFTEEEKQKSIKLGRIKNAEHNFKNDDNVTLFIEERTPGFEYVGNYTGTDGFADIRCKKCGNISTKSMVSIRHRKTICLNCKKIESEKKKAEELAEKELQRKSREELQEKKNFDSLVKSMYRNYEMKECPICKDWFLGTTQEKYCSKECRNQNNYNMKDGYRYKFPLDEIYKRDQGICHLCGGICDWEDYKEENGIIIYGNNYPSRDHIIPKSRGGKNSWENLKLAHRICNSLKGAKIG